MGGVVEIELAGGGHPQPLLRAHDGRITTVPLGGSLLGMLDDPAIDRRHITLAPGTTFVLYTDGILEARSPEGVFFDEAGIREVLAAPMGDARSTAEHIESAVLAHTGHDPQDDMAIVVLQTRS